MPDVVVEKQPEIGLQSIFDKPSKPVQEAPSKAVKPEESSSSEKKEEKKVEPVKAVEKKDEGKAEIKEEKKSPEPKKDEVKTSSVDWETDDNPYKKRYQNTQSWGTTLNQQNLELKKNFEMLNKKLDGTWNPEEEAKASQPDPRQLFSQAETLGKVKASARVAVERYGADKVQAMIFADNAPFRKFDNDSAIQARVLSADAPVLEAFRILEENDFRAKWGNDPKAIEENIRKKTEEELTKTITENVTKQIMERLNLKEKQLTTVGDARSAEGAPKAGANGSPTLKTIFDGR